MERENHPYDRGYWARYDGKDRRTLSGDELKGWDDCDEEIAAEVSQKEKK